MSSLRLFLLSSSICLLLTLDCEGSSSSLKSDFISNLLSSFFPQHKLLILLADFNSSSKASRKWKWKDNLEKLSSNPGIISESGGVSHVKVHSNQTDFISIKRTPRLLGEVGQVVLLLLPDGIPSKVEEKVLNQSLVLPLLGPPTVKNMDKFIILTEERHLRELYMNVFFRKLKFKLVLTEEGKGSSPLQLHQFCGHCPIQENIMQIQQADPPSLSSFKSLYEFFPDFERNFFGTVLRTSATDKLYGDMEYGRDPLTGKVYPKRGVFADVLAHLSLGLNFSGEAYISSGGGGTGSKLGNNTWVGGVGDVYNGGAVFCMMCSMSLGRYEVVDMCSPVAYEYVFFTVGPPHKIYTWEAIFWPFSLGLWMAIIGMTGVNILCSYIFLKWKGHGTRWNVLSVTQYLGRVFLDQGDELPVGLPQAIRIILGFWLLFALIASNLYRAKMVTFMTFPVHHKVPSNFDELVESNYQIEFHYYPGVVYNILKVSKIPVYKKTFQRLIKEPDPMRCMEDTLKSKSVCIVSTSVFDSAINRNLSDQYGRTPIKAAPGYAFLFNPGIVLEKFSVVNGNFRWILQNCLERGINQHWQKMDARFLQREKNKWERESGGNGFRFEYDDDGIMKLRHLKGAFVILFGGVVAALFAFLRERLGKVFRFILEQCWTRVVIWAIQFLELSTGQCETPLNQQFR